MDKTEELFETFSKEMFKMEPINFIGLAKLMGVQIANEAGDDLREMAEIISDIFNSFQEISNSKKKEIIKLCKQANKMTKRGEKHGHRSKNSKHENQ